MKIYFPMTAQIITKGHIKCLEWLRDYKHQLHPLITIGLLTDKALKGYKKCIVPYRDRKYVLETIANGIRKGDCRCIHVVPQSSLDPSENIKKYKPVAIASGDGWEKEELEAIKKFNLIKIDIKLPKKYSSSLILKKLCQKKF